MAEKFQNKYRIPSARLDTWDYSRTASYFVTICTQNKEHYFGDIVNDEMRVSEIGKMVQAEWLKTPEIRPDMNLELGAFVVMPNHFHAIVTIGENNFNSPTDPRRDAVPASFSVPTSFSEPASPLPPATTISASSPESVSPLPANSNTDPQPISPLPPEYKNSFGIQSQNLASVIRGFKASVTRQARNLHADFAWQARYHEHIIRDAKSYRHIEDYIWNNPFTWKDDKFFG